MGDFASQKLSAWAADEVNVHAPRGGLMGSILLVGAKTIIEYLARGIEFAAALIIGMAAMEATIKSLILFFKPSAPAELKNGVRLTLGRWLAVGLEFELAADILNTAVTPTWNDIEKLAAIATLRTLLNYFLEREIRQEATPSQRAAEQQAEGAAAEPLRGYGASK
jgi:uncharacterized membrane protein